MRYVLFAALLAVAACDKSPTGASTAGSATAALPSATSTTSTIARADGTASAPTPAASTESAPPSPPPTAVAAQHVLVAYAGAKDAPKGTKRTKPEARTRAEEVAAKAKAGGDFSELVKTYSDDPGARDRQGSVGKFTRDKMVKPFSDAAFVLKVDETSGAVETPYGFHVIKRNQ